MSWSHHLIFWMHILIDFGEHSIILNYFLPIPESLSSVTNKEALVSRISTGLQSCSTINCSLEFPNASSLLGGSTSTERAAHSFARWNYFARLTSSPHWEYVPGVFFVSSSSQEDATIMTMVMMFFISYGHQHLHLRNKDFDPPI